MSKLLALGLLSIVLPMGCDQCEDIGNLSSSGVFEPAAFNFGLVNSGETCATQLKLINNGQGVLTISSSEFVDKNGDFKIDGITPAEVEGLGSSVLLPIAYTAGTPGNGAESATLQLHTNMPKDDGIVAAALRGTPVSGNAGVVATMCKIDETETNPCPELNFGATVAATDNPGVVRTLRLINDGTAPMNVTEPVITGNAYFVIDGARVPNTDGLGGMVEVTTWPLQLDPARGTCGADSGNAKTYLEVSVRFQPLTMGGAAGTLSIATDAQVAPATVEMSLVGIGSGDGIDTDPDVLQFGEVAVGSELTKDVRVFNLRLDQVLVNTSCLDINANGTCDAAPTDVECTALDSAAAVSCDVSRVDGTNEGKGFQLGAADAVAGGDDEALIKVRWAPTAAGPLRTKLLLPTNIQDGRTWEVLVVGGSAGELTVSPDPIVVDATGTTLHGSKTFTVSNTGQAPLTIVETKLVGAIGITAEFTLTRAGDSNFSVNGALAWTTPYTLNAGTSDTFTLQYMDSGSLNCDDLDLYFTHDGSGQSPAIIGIQVNGDNC